MQHWWVSLCDKRFAGHENAIQNAPCNRPLMLLFVTLFPPKIHNKKNHEKRT
jgi:hypothetical protein